MRQRERLFDDLAKQLARIHPNLTFEFGPKADKREFVVSAAGIKKAFSEVRNLLCLRPALSDGTLLLFDRGDHSPT